MPVIGENVDENADHIEELVTGRSKQLRDREYVAVLFTDIVDSTAHLVEAGDKRWRDILDTPRPPRAPGVRVPTTAAW